MGLGASCMLQCVVLCCSVLQCAAVCLQYSAVCCSMLQCVALYKVLAHSLARSAAAMRGLLVFHTYLQGQKLYKSNVCAHACAHACVSIALHS